MKENFDYIVAGGGVAGVAMASQLHRAHPSARILILEKEYSLGGRLRTSGRPEDGKKKCIHGYGLGAVSEDLLTFVNQELDQENPAAACDFHKQSRLGIIAAGRVNELPMNTMFSADGFRAIGGGAAAKEWKRDLAVVLGEDSDEEERKNKTFLNLWKGKPKKSAGAIVLQHYARMVGIADTWSASLAAIKKRAEVYASGLRMGDLSKALEALTSRENVSLLENCRIGIAEKDEAEGHWLLHTEQGEFTTNTLVVAQPPWQALDWLAKTYWPKDVLAITSKTTPVSIVSLATELVEGNAEDICDVLLLPAEEVQIVKGLNNEICFQATIDYEISLQSANVVKSIKKLKRARKKFMEAYPQCKLEGEAVSLVPVGWSQSTHLQAQEYIDKLDMNEQNRDDLLFCGDAYGTSYDFDRNVIESIQTATSALT